MRHASPTAYLEVGSVILGDEGAVTLAEHRYFLLNVFYLVFRFLQVDGLDGNHLLGAIVDAFEDLSKGAFAYPVQLGEQLLWVGREVLIGGDRAERNRVNN